MQPENRDQYPLAGKDVHVMMQQDRLEMMRKAWSRRSPSVPSRRTNCARAEIPIVGFGPGNSSGNHHAPDGNLRIEDYQNYRASVEYVVALLCSYGHDGKEGL